MEIQIGELAELQGISNQTLHYYDRIGLVKPKIHPVNGYRFYTQKSIFRLDTIFALKNSGMSLKAIGDFLEKSDPEETSILLEDQSINLGEAIRRLEQIKAQLDMRLEIVKRYKEDEKDIGFVELEGMDLAVLDVPSGSDTLTIEVLIKSLYFHVKKLEAQQILDLGVLVDRDAILKGGEETIPLKSLAIPLTKAYPESPFYRRLEPARYAYIYHKGEYWNSAKSYRRLVKFIRDNGEEILGDGVEFPVIDTLLTQDETLFVTEVLIPVSSR